jgi:rhomboid family GlyGly-CTERM serine protease
MTSEAPASLSPPCVIGSPRAAAGKASRTGWRAELWIFLILLLLFNLPILRGTAATAYIFLPGAVQQGEWWRLLTHPFVHVSWYHLLLDASAFLMLYHGLSEPGFFRRITYVLGSVAGSVLCAWGLAPNVAAHGLCGLSGAAHGLMAISSVELMLAYGLNSKPGRMGLYSFLIVVGKAAMEGWTGHLFFEWLHFGLLGDPIAVSHGGGVASGLLVFLALKAIPRAGTTKNAQCEEG